MRVFCPVILATAVLLTGCSAHEITDSGAWKSSKEFYYGYINTPVTLDLSDPGSLSAANRALVQRMMDVDIQLADLERALDALPPSPDSNSLGAIMQRLPWLTGVHLLRPDGSIMISVPPVQMKQVDFEVLLEAGEKQAPRALRSAIQETPLGAEILVGRPIYQGPDMIALVAASFDWSSLMNYTRTPADVLVRTPDTVLWNQAGLNFPEANWANALKSSSYGQVGSSTWVVRYLGAMPLIFAAQAS